MEQLLISPDKYFNEFSKGLNESRYQEFKSLVGFVGMELIAKLEQGDYVLGMNRFGESKIMYTNNSPIPSDVYNFNVPKYKVPVATYNTGVIIERNYFVLSAFITKDEINKITDESVKHYIK